MNTDIVEIQPEKEWIVDWLDIPPIYYNISTEHPHYDDTEKLLPGASWPFAINEPHWKFRRAIFEDNYFPYKFKFYYLPIFNGFIALDKLNLCYLTNLNDPSIVYMKLNNKILQKIKFENYGIYITEFIN